MFFSQWRPHFIAQTNSLKIRRKVISRLCLSLMIWPVAYSCSRLDNADMAAETAAATGSNTVTILGVVVGDQQAKLEAALAPFEEETGIEVLYEGTDAFTTLLPVRVDSGDSPDIAMFPQPGLMRSLAEEGALIPVTEILTPSELETYYPDTWIELSTVGDEIYGIWYRSAVKSLVWYNPKEFTEAGYETPETWDELIALSNQIVADGGTPWCLGLESGNASGWPGTDWVEDVVLQNSGPEFYEKWVQHEVPFNAPEVQEAFQYFGEIAKTPDYLYGGQTGALSIPWGDSISGLFNQKSGTDEPECYMQKQGNFISGFFPEDVVIGEDVDFFPTPVINPAYENSLLVAGDIFSMLNDTPEARQLMAYLATPTPHEIWAERGGFLSANKQVDLDVYPDELSRKQAELLTTAEVVQFDASDAMPGAVGTGTFWSGMMDFVAGATAEEVTDKIEFYWPKERPTEEAAEEGSAEAVSAEDSPKAGQLQSKTFHKNSY
ncbi:MAG: ABC transporter substrate-binding protein [Cyanobacteria bacterium J06626_6]